MTDVLNQEQAQKQSLPDGWIEASFGDLADYLNGRAFKKSEWHSTGRPIIRIQNLTGSSQTLNRFTGMVEDRYIVRDGDLLISWSATLGAYIYHGEEAVLNQHIFKVEPYINRRFLFYLTNAYIDNLRRQAHGSGMQHITKTKFETSRVPLPPLNEQHRIVEKIEELFTKLDAGVQSLKQTQTLLKSYRRSVLKAAVEGELSREWREAHEDELEPASVLLERILQERREKFAGKKYKEPASPDTLKLPELPDRWEWASVDQLSYIDVGPAFKSSEFSSSGIRLLRGQNIEPGALRWTDTKYWPEVRLPPYTHLLIEQDQIILAMDRPVISSGLKIARVKASDVPCLLVQRVARFRPFQMSTTDFLYISMQTEEFIKHLLGGQTGTQLPHISATGIASYITPVPPLEEQCFIVSEVERRLSVVDKLEATVEANLKQAGGLRQSILKQAYSGELVTQDLDDEPASVLLERIKAEHQAAKPKAREGRKSNARPTKANHAGQRGLF